MGNKHRGIVDVPAGDDTYHLRFGANEFVEIEEVFGLNGIEEIEKVFSGGVSMKNMRTLFRIGLGDQHPEIAKLPAKEADKQAGRIMADVGVKVALEYVTEAIKAAFPDSEGDADGAGDPPATATN